MGHLRPAQLLLFSAQARDQLILTLRAASGEDLVRLSAACAIRPPGPHRVAIIASTTSEFDERRAQVLAHLSGPGADRPLSVAGFVSASVALTRARTACLFPGLGIRRTTLPRDLCRAFPVVERWSDSLVSVAQNAQDAQASRAASGSADRPPSETALELVLLADLAMWVLLRDLGFVCDGLVGHSLGEYAALVASGMVGDYEALVSLLGELQAQAGLAASARNGDQLGMLAISAASRPLLDPWLHAEPPQVYVSLDNCPQQLVVWGESRVLEAIEREAKSRRHVVFRLPALKQPVHTPLLQVPLATIRARFNGLQLAEAQCPAWSTASAALFPGDPDRVRDLLAEQWRTTVRFREVIERLHADGVTTFVEVGPADRLSGFARDTLRGTGAVAIATNLEGRDAVSQILVAVAQLFVRGHDLDVRRLAQDRVAASMAPVVVAPQSSGPSDPAPTGSTLALVAREVAAILELTSTDGLDADRGFFDLGLGSIGCITLADRLSRALDVDVAQTLPFEHPSITQLAAALDAVDRRGEPIAASARLINGVEADRDEIAVVGLGCRFPGGADSPEAYWRLLSEGRHAVSEVPDDRWAPALFNVEDAADIQKRASFGAFLDDIRGFEPGFFGISPREALTLDPQQRLLLEVAWEALEYAAIDPRSLRGSRTGVFVGISNADYASRLSLRERLAIGGYLGTGNTASTASGRLSFALGLVGPSLSIDTACSSSLTSVHLAVQSLRRRESDVAIAGGVNLLINPETTIFLSHARAISEHGRCATFDAAADGYVRGEGCGLVVLKRVSDARAAGDTVLAVIRGSAVNHGGHTSGLTVPSARSQEIAIREALADAFCAPDAIGYVEAHGTGTALGDPIEINALGRVFGNARTTALRLGAVKTNIGHLEAAAGVAGLIKVVLQHMHRALAPTLHFERPNPRADWASFGGEVVTHLEAWPEGQASGVSSFGISGTNAHAVVGDAPSKMARPPAVTRPSYLLPISARSTEALRAVASRLADHLRQDSGLNLAALARTLTVGRAHLAKRIALQVSSVAEAITALDDVASGIEPAAAAAEDARRYARGETIEWAEAQVPGPRLALPTYPFEREPYWIAGTADQAVAPATAAAIAAVDQPAERFMLDELRAAAAADRSSIVVAYLQAAVSAILGLPTERPIDAEQVLCDAGMDSLTALALSGAMQQALGVRVAASDIVDGASVASLTQLVLAHAPDQASDRTTDSTPGPSSPRVPLSYGQRALWFIWRLAPATAAYNQSLPLHLVNVASPAPWREAVGLLVARHPMLRTRFVEEHGEPSQLVEARADVGWNETDATSYSSAQLAAAIERAHARPFDLSSASPLRCHWFHRAGGDAVLLLTQHHITCDAWSFEIIRRELSDMVAALQAGKSWKAPPPSHTYQDFVRWQRHMLDGPAGASLWNFWRDQLADPHARLELPLDLPRPAVQTYDGTAVRIDVPREISRDLRAVASKQGVTPFVLVLTSFLTLLHRWTRQRDLTVGIPTAGRSQSEWSGIVGYFVEMVAMRVPLAEGATFATFLAEVNQRSRAALAHGDFPYPLIVERLRLPRDASRSPIFDVTFNFLSRRSAEAGRHGASLPQTLEMPQADGKFDLTLTVIEDHDGVHASMGFNTALFEAATIARMGDAWAHILAEVCRDPEQSVDAVPMSSRDTGAALFGRTQDLTRARPVHHAILAHAHATPARLAVVGEDEALTYAQLQTRVAAMATKLRARGVAADVPVGLCTPRNTSFVVGLLAILEAGGAFVPLDPSLPEAVRSGMLRQAGATLLVQAEGDQLVIVGEDARQTSAAPVLGSPLEHLAYVIFTSGSTGTPKGVAVEHRALANYVASVDEDLGIEPHCQHAMVSTIAADLGHTVLFPSLVTGGTLHLLSNDVATDSARFADYLRTHEIDYLKIVPSHLAALANATGIAVPRKAVFLGGEASRSEWAAALARSGCRVFNHYGPTETTVGVMTYAFDPAQGCSSPQLPLNRAVANTSVWILDEARRPVLPGIPGEIYVSGASLARGYINDPARTDERFVLLADGTRAYRTGDLARQRPDGSLLLLGREDRQLKLRGYRIELAHIEQTLIGYPGIRQAVVLPDADSASSATLLAWMVADPLIELPDLQKWLAERLPSYMVPTRVMTIAAIPVTGNGKVDVAALRATMPVSDARVRPALTRDLVELRLRRIWIEVLAVAEVGPLDDFFELGGHSLGAVRLASMIRDQLGAEVPLAALFTHRTLEQLATLVRASTPSETSSPIVRMQLGAARPPVICFPGAGGSLLYFQDLLTALGHDVPVWGAQAVGLAGSGAIPGDVSALAARYLEGLRDVRRASGPLTLVGHSFGALVAFDVARQLSAEPGIIARLLILDQVAPGATGHDEVTDRDWIRHIALRIERLYGVDLGVDRETAPDRNWLMHRLVRAGALPPDTNRDHVSRYVDVYQANVRAAAAYRPVVGPLNIPITVLAADEDDDALGLGDPRRADASLGWSTWTTQPVSTTTVPGTHITMLRAPAVRAVANLLLERLR